MLAELTPRQFAEWQAWLEGIGESDDQMNTATATSAIVNELRELRRLLLARYGSKTKVKSVAASAYLRRWRPPARKKRQSVAEQLSILKRLG